MPDTKRKRLKQQARIGARKIVKGVTYELNKNFRWQRAKKEAGKLVRDIKKQVPNEFNEMFQTFSTIYKKNKDKIKKEFKLTASGISKNMRKSLMDLSKTAGKEMKSIYSASKKGERALRKQIKRSKRKIKFALAKEAVFGTSWNPASGKKAKMIHKRVKRTSKKLASQVESTFGKQAGKRARLASFVVSRKFRPRKKRR